MVEKDFENYGRYKEDTITCYEYGSSSGCDEHCPVLNKGDCEIWESVKEFLLEND